MTPLERIGDLGFKLWPVGSRYICNPAPTDTDQDYLMYVPVTKFYAIDSAVCDLGWLREGSEIADRPDRNSDDRFHSYRHGDINVIITPSYKFYRRFLAANEIAKRFNLLDKSDRLALFHAVIFGEGGPL